MLYQQTNEICISVLLLYLTYCRLFEFIWSYWYCKNANQFKNLLNLYVSVDFYIVWWVCYYEVCIHVSGSYHTLNEVSGSNYTSVCTKLFFDQSFAATWQIHKPNCKNNFVSCQLTNNLYRKWWRHIYGSGHEYN